MTGWCTTPVVRIMPETCDMRNNRKDEAGTDGVWRAHRDNALTLKPRPNNAGKTVRSMIDVSYIEKHVFIVRMTFVFARCLKTCWEVHIEHPRRNEEGHEQRQRKCSAY